VSPNRDSNEIIEFLIKNGANVDYKAKYIPSALLQAVIVKNADVVQTLIKYRANVNDTFGSDNFTALMQACLEGSDLIVNILLKNGANVNMINSTGMSALNFATEYINRYPERKLKFLNIIKMLIEHNADITDKIMSSIDKINDRNIRNAIFLLIKQNRLEDYLLLFEHAKKLLSGGNEHLISQFKEQIQGSDMLYTGEVLPYIFKREPDSGKQRRKMSKKKRSKRSKKRSCRRHIVRY
jgi:ankyrin repeat protein